MLAADRDHLRADLTRLAQGDRSAAPVAFRALWPVVRTFAARAVADEARAEDLAQQAIVKLFEQASRYDASKDALAWALEIVTWEIRTERRRVLRAREEAWVPALETVAATTAGPESALEATELRAALEAALGELSAADRETIAAVLHETDGPVSGATWRKRKERALSRLRDAWRRLHAAD